MKVHMIEKSQGGSIIILSLFYQPQHQGDRWCHFQGGEGRRKSSLGATKSLILDLFKFEIPMSHPTGGIIQEELESKNLEFRVSDQNLEVGIQSSNKYVLSFDYMPDTVLGIEDTH